MKSTRLTWVENSKGIGIILVIYGHIMLGLRLSEIKINNFLYDNSIRLVYSFHMPLFFLLAGFFFQNSLEKRGTSLFIIEKLKTIIYPFVVWSLIDVLIEIALSKYTNNHTTISTLFVCLYIPKAQFWFLMALFLYNLINGIFFNFLGKYWLAVSIIISVLLFQLPIHSSQDSYERIIKHFVYFNFGIIMSRNIKNKDIFSHVFRPAVITGSIILFFAIEYFFLFTGYNRILWSLFLPQIFGILIVIQLSTIFLRYNFSFFQYIGQYSFQIYLLHIIFAAGARIFLSKIFHTNIFIIYLFTALIVATFMPILVYQFAVKRKYLSWLFIFPLSKTTDTNLQNILFKNEKV